jgi:hypothetical protein
MAKVAGKVGGPAVGVMKIKSLFTAAHRAR